MNTRALSSRLLASSALLLCALAQPSSPQSPAPSQTTTAPPPTAPQPAATRSPAPAPQTAATRPAPTRAPQMKLTRRRFIEPNLLAPELYSDKLSMRLTLVDLPGASDPGSTWEGGYKLYFISEAEFERAAGEVRKKAAAGGAASAGWNPTPADFPEKILLAAGSISKKNLATPPQRVLLQEGIPFKEKVPAALRTKGAHLLVAYSVKVYDAKLKTPVYDSGVFFSLPFDDETDPDKIAPRTVVYTNFIVTPKGEIFASKLPREAGDTRWP